MKKILKVVTLTLFICSSALSNSLGIGFRWSTVFMMRYWQAENGTVREKIVLFNADSVETQIRFVLAKSIEDRSQLRSILDTSIARPNLKWNIPARSFITIDAPHPTLEPEERYFYFVFQGAQPYFGLIDVTTPQPDIRHNSRIQITEGINESGGQSSHCWWEIQSLILKSGDTTTATLRLLPPHEDMVRIEALNWTESTMKGTAALELIGATGNSPYQATLLSGDSLANGQSSKSSTRGRAYTLSSSQISSPPPQYLKLAMQICAPKVTEPTIGILDVKIESLGRGFPLALIVIP